jgi:hypothetical protein
MEVCHSIVRIGNSKEREPKPSAKGYNHGTQDPRAAATRSAMFTPETTESASEIPSR